jgi:peptidoglycan hydrolase-like protein with peptidoglycan-binding domain
VSSPRPASSGIPTERVTEIQRALIKEGYLEGQASGQYDDATIAAMKQFQSDNGFAASGLPSAYTLKKLGVSKRSNNSYAVPINSATEDQKKPQQTAPQVKKGKTSGEAGQIEQ